MDREIREAIERLAAISARIAAGIEKDVAALEAEVVAAERLLASLIASRVLEQMQVGEGGRIVNSAANMAIVTTVDQVFLEIAAVKMYGISRSISRRVERINQEVAEYFRAGSFSEETVEEIARDMTSMQARLGIDSLGNLVPGGYLDTLARGAEVRDRLKQFMLQAVSSRVPLQAMTRDLRTIIMGGGANNVNGAMVQYYRTYAYDVFNQAREIRAEQFAQRLKLRHFIYQGSVIDTSRRFCRKRAGKPFTTAEAAQWKNDPDLIDKKTRATYNPIVERGRYNCRHWIDWISPEMYDQLKPSP